MRPSLVRLAGVFEDTAILYIPSGVESMCVDLELGRYVLCQALLNPKVATARREETPA